MRRDRRRKDDTMRIQLSDHFTYKKIWRFSLPPIVMMVFTSIYGVVDGLFVSNFVGKVPFAAINLVMPFIMILGGFGFMIGTGGSALVAKTIGEGDREKANRYFSMMIQLTLAAGIVLSVIGVLFIRPISYLLGATDAMIEDCVVYGRVVLLFNTAFMLQNVFQTFLAAAEKPKLGLAATVAAGVTNMALDALFVAGFRWGVGGAALANGSSELMTNISGSLVSMLYNVRLLKFAGENGVAAYGVLMYIQFIFIAIFIGYTIGMAPVVGYHYGAENTGELKSLLRKSLLLMGIAGVLMMLVAQILALPLAAVFVGYDAELLEMTRHAFAIFAFSFVLAGFNIFASAFFTALNNGLVSAAISFLRTLVFQMLSVLILPLLFGLDGIWWAITAAEAFACMISLAFLVAKRKTYRYM